MPGTAYFLVVAVLPSLRGWGSPPTSSWGRLSRAAPKWRFVDTRRASARAHIRVALTGLRRGARARQACIEGIARHDPSAIISCSMTASLLWPRPVQLLDSIARRTVPGVSALVSDRSSAGGCRETPMVARDSTARSHRWMRRRRVPITWCCARPRRASGTSAPTRDVDLVAYSGNPEKSAWTTCSNGRSARTPVGVGRGGGRTRQLVFSFTYACSRRADGVKVGGTDGSVAD